MNKELTHPDNIHGSLNLLDDIVAIQQTNMQNMHAEMKAIQNKEKKIIPTLQGVLNTNKINRTVHNNT